MTFDTIISFISANVVLAGGLAVVVLAFAVNEWRGVKNGAKSLSPQQAVLLMNRGEAPVIDVRETNAFLNAYISGTKNIPLSTLSELTLTQFEKTKPIILLADMGSQTEQAVAKLKALQFSDIRIVEGGLDGWKAAGFPVETAKGAKK